MSAPITEQDRMEAVENVLAQDKELAPQLALIDALDQHYLRHESSRNLGYYRTFIECSCGTGWWYGEHSGDPSASDRWSIHRAQVLLAVSPTTEGDTPK